MILGNDPTRVCYDASTNEVHLIRQW